MKSRLLYPVDAEYRWPQLERRQPIQLTWSHLLMAFVGWLAGIVVGWAAHGAFR